MNNTKAHKAIMFSALCIVFIISACSTSAPEIIELDVSIKNKTMTPNEISMNKNDTLVMNISSDENGSLHIHGYDIEKKISKSVD